MDNKNENTLNPLLMSPPTIDINNFVYQNVGEDTNNGRGQHFNNFVYQNVGEDTKDGSGQIKTNHS